MVWVYGLWFRMERVWAVRTAGVGAERMDEERAMPLTPVERSEGMSASVIPPMATTGRAL